MAGQKERHVQRPTGMSEADEAPERPEGTVCSLGEVGKESPFDFKDPFSFLFKKKSHTYLIKKLILEWLKLLLKHNWLTSRA